MLVSSTRYEVYNYQLQIWVTTDDPDLACIDSEGVLQYDKVNLLPEVYEERF